MVLNVSVKSVSLDAEGLKLPENSNIEICDVIGCHLSEEPSGFLSSLFGSAPCLVIQYISRGKNYKWTAESVHVSGSKGECEALEASINQKLGQETERPKKLAVFINPIGGSQNAVNVFSKTISPLFRSANIVCDVIVSERPKHIIDIMKTFDTTSVDGLVLLGGDGTLLEVVNCLLTRTQKEAGVECDQPTCKLRPLDIPIGVIPTGTGNGTAKGLYGNYDVVTAALHVIRGRTSQCNIQAVYSGGKLVSFSTIIVACGLFSEMIYHTERMRWLQKARYIIIPFYLMLFKKQRLFDAKLTVLERDSNPEDIDGTNEKSSPIDWKGIWGILSCGGEFKHAVESKMDTMEMFKHSQESGAFNLIVYRGAGRIAFLKHFFQLMTLHHQAFQKDFLTPYTVKSYSVKIQCCDESIDPESEEARINNILDVDGELIDIVDGEFEVWNHRQLVKYYTSIGD